MGRWAAAAIAVGAFILGVAVGENVPSPAQKILDQQDQKSREEQRKTEECLKHVKTIGQDLNCRMDPP